MRTTLPHAGVAVGTDWESVYEETYVDLVRFLYRQVWDDERAHDLAQEAFVRALQNEPRTPRAWLFSVARNLARDEARTAASRRRHLALLRSEASDGEGEDPHDVLERSERRESVRRALASLGERDREVLLLWDAGLSYEEIAEQTGLARGAVGTTLARARRRLVEAHGTEEGSDAAHL